MLNAFRHLRFIHLGAGDNQVAKFLCSTPFGISDSFTHDVDSLSRGTTPVLNAFRHLRFIHWLTDVVHAICVVCSTPFGISDSFTLAWSRQEISALCAQRLSASQIHSRGDVFRLSITESVLNAFRHLRFIHSRELTSTRRRLSRAQRLSASQIHSPPRTE